MAVYFDHKIQNPSGTGGAYTELQWHNIHKLLAVGSYIDHAGGSVNIYMDEVSIRI